ncbi:MAG: GNAT family N-acetyltransferase [Hyphomicrobiales bacterium]|nr:MAG: GNAT family N-acetyltransferase [Hyphomicrobiales bacterium]
MSSDVAIRAARESDLLQIVALANHYILHTNAMFTTEPQTIEGRKLWFDGYGAGRYRLLVAEDATGLLGCAYSSRYRPTPAFDATVETSIYLQPDRRGAGLGARLYAALFDILRKEDVHLAVAGVAQPNAASNALHLKCGFEEVGTFREYARKGNVWISSTWFQKMVA